MPVEVEVPAPDVAAELDPDVELVPEPDEPAEGVEDAAVEDLLALSDWVVVGVFSDFDSVLLVSAGCPLFSDLVPGSFSLSE